MCGAYKIYVLPPLGPLIDGLWQLGMVSVGMRTNENMVFCSTLLGKCRTDTTLASLLWNVFTHAFLSNTLHDCLFWSNSQCNNVIQIILNSPSCQNPWKPSCPIKVRAGSLSVLMHGCSDTHCVVRTWPRAIKPLCSIFFYLSSWSLHLDSKIYGQGLCPFLGWHYAK